VLVLLDFVSRRTTKHLYSSIGDAPTRRVVMFIGAGTGMAVGGIKGNYARVNPIRRVIQMLYIRTIAIVIATVKTANARRRPFFITLSFGAGTK